MKAIPTNSTGLRATAVLAFLLTAAGTSFAQEQAADQWPVVFTIGSDRVQVFTPQPERIDGDHFTARFAVSIKRPGDTDPVYGAVWGNGVLALDRSTRLGELTSLTVTDVRFPGVDDPTEQQRIKDMLSVNIPKHTAPIAIDWLIAALENEQQGVATYANDPPEIIYREKPGVLVYIDGEPQYAVVSSNEKDKQFADPNYTAKATEVERVVNTPFMIVRQKGGDHYLYGSNRWFTSKSVEGPWSSTYTVPQELRAMAQKVDTTASLSVTNADGSAVTPEIVVRTTPAVLLDLDGPPQFQPLPGTSLLYATNTDDDLFLDVATQDNYLLASGRWFATRSPKTGPWRYVPADQLPAEFSKIPEGSVKDGALAHIPGTPAAREAVRDASIPQTAKVDRRTANVKVDYDGDPLFERIPGTQVENALNANVTVLRIGGMYHALDNGVWFEGATPHGPWSVSTYVPDEVSTIPPSSAAYHTRYVYIYDSTPDMVYMGYTPGYLGAYVQGGVVIYGTGYYYQPWPRRWYPRPYTWGFGVQYNPWVGWSFGMGWGWNWYYPSWYGWGGYGGYFGGYGWGYPYSCGYGWWGPQGYYPQVVNDHHYNYGHRTSLGSTARAQQDGRSGAVRNPATDLYSERAAQGVRSTTVGRNPVTRTEQAPTLNEGRTTRASTPDHFTDREGNVYRREDGGTAQYAEGRWQRLPETPRTTTTERTTNVPVRPTVPTDRTTRTTTPERAPQVDPRRIQEDRNRGQQRVIDFNRSRQQQPVAKPTRSAPTPRNVAPPRTAPTRTTSPSRSTPSAPSSPRPTTPTRSPR